MKKLLALLIALASLSCFTACNDDEKESKSSRSEDSKITTESETEEKTEPSTEKTTEKKVEYETYEDDFIVLDYPNELRILGEDYPILFVEFENQNYSISLSKTKNDKIYDESYIYDYIKSEKNNGKKVEQRSYGLNVCAFYPKNMGEDNNKYNQYAFTNGEYMFFFATELEPDDETLTKIFKSIDFKYYSEEPITEKPTEKPTEPKTEPATEKKPENNSGSTSSAREALTYAKSYLSFSDYSYLKLIEQLEFSDFSHEDAVYAADNCGADWKDQALKCAKTYIKNLDFSYQELKDQLEYEQFTPDQIQYGVDNCGADWNAEALESAKSYIKNLAFSYQGLKEQLEHEGFTAAQINHGVNNCGADWFEEAAECAKSYVRHSSFTREELLNQLLFEGFTAEQAEHGVKAAGF